MQFLRCLVVASLWAVLVTTGGAQAETKVELSGVHLCCGQCVKVASAILKDAGVDGKCDQKTKTIAITAPDDKAAQKALDALAKSGFHGKSSNDKVKMKEDSGAKKGKVQSVTLTQIHDCCGNCNKAIKSVLMKVDGVSGDTATAKKDTFEVTGNFDAAELVKALNDAGFHVKVK